MQFHQAAVRGLAMGLEFHRLPERSPRALEKAHGHLAPTQVGPDDEPPGVERNRPLEQGERLGELAVEEAHARGQPGDEPVAGRGRGGLVQAVLGTLLAPGEEDVGAREPDVGRGAAFLDGAVGERQGRVELAETPEGHRLGGEQLGAGGELFEGLLGPGLGLAVFLQLDEHAHLAGTVAAEDQGFKELDEITVKLHLAQAQRLVYGRGEPRATSIIVQLHHTSAIPDVAPRLRKLTDEVMPGHSLAVLDFEEINPYYGETIALFNTIFGFIFVLIGGIVLFTVSNTMMAAVMERTTEIGTVRAVGLRQRGIRQLFVTEGFLLGCVGALVGVVSALVLAALVNSLGLTWLPPGTSTPLPLTIRVFSETGMIIGTAIGLVAIATLSAWLPAWRAANLSIVDALRHA